MNIYVVTYLSYNDLGTIEFTVAEAFTKEGDAHAYCELLKNEFKDRICYTVNETVLDERYE
jgi:hypothetical protein